MPEPLVYLQAMGVSASVGALLVLAICWPWTESARTPASTTRATVACLLAICGGAVIGSSDRIGAYPASSPQTPENMAATIYHALGIPSTAMWRDTLDRPHHVYHGQPIAGLI